MSHIYTQECRLWDENHENWPKKKDGKPYKRIPSAKKQAMESEGTWPTLYKSVTTYLSWAKGPAIAGWMVSLAKQAAVEAHSAPGGDFEKTLAKIYNEKRNAASDAGSALHDEIEKYLSCGTTPNSWQGRVAVRDIDALLRGRGLNKGDGLYEVTFVAEYEGIPFAGTADAVFPGQYVFDWKTTGGKKDVPYPDQPAQLAAYMDGLYNAKAFSLPEQALGNSGTETCCNVWINQEDGRVYKVKEYTERQLEMGMELFLHCAEIDELIKELGKMT